ncbi:MAG: VIT domain-containing protein, partial [Candidatus Bipolaricaulia bacterium]
MIAIRRSVVPTLLMLLLVALVSQVGRTQVIVGPEPASLVWKRQVVNVEIQDQLAHVEVEQVFYNPNPSAVEGTYLFPLPPGTVVSGLSLCSGGECFDGQLLNETEARQIYEEIVRKIRDPALLEYVGGKIFRVRLFPIPANGEQEIQLSYQQLLPEDGSLVEFVYPLVRAGDRSIGQFAVNVRVRENEPLANLYSPSHAVNVRRISDVEASVSFETA